MGVKEKQGGNEREERGRVMCTTYLPIENIIKESLGLDGVESRDVVDNNTCTEEGSD